MTDHFLLNFSTTKMEGLAAIFGVFLHYGNISKVTQKYQKMSNYGLIHYFKVPMEAS